MTCPNPDLCVVLKRHVHGRLWTIWRGRDAAGNSVLTPEKCEQYRVSWARKAGVSLQAIRHLGATGPPPQVPPPASKIGDRLVAIIKRETGSGIPCGECKKQIERLNSMSPDKAAEKRSEIIDEIADRAKRQAPKFWQRMAVVVDSALHTGETKRRIGRWLDETINAEEED